MILTGLLQNYLFEAMLGVCSIANNPLFGIFYKILLNIVSALELMLHENIVITIK